MSDTSSAMPPKHHARSGSHGKMAAHHPSRFPNLQGNVANQLNQVELSRLESGNFAPPTPPEMSTSGGPSAPTPRSPPNPQMNRKPAGGRATSGTFN
jgi:hypothetical protein